MSARGAAAIAAAVVAGLAGPAAAAAAADAVSARGETATAARSLAGTGPASLASHSTAVTGPAAAPYVTGEVVIRRESGATKVVKISSRASVPTEARRLTARPGVASATPNYIASATAHVPDDPGRAGTIGGWRNDQWSFLAGPGGIDASGAWSTLGSSAAAPGAGTAVAVLDSGVAYRRHGAGFRADPDLAGTSFLHPRDFVDRDRLPLDENGHGTHVASTIAETTDNDMGLTGVAYGAQVIPVRVLDASLHGSATQIARGIRFAAKHGAKVINLSLAFGPAVTRCAQISVVCRAIRSAAKHGALVIAAAGNSAAPSPAMPAAAPKVLSIAAATERGCLASYSNRRAALVAPGGGADAAIPGDESCDPSAATGAGITQYSLDPGAAASGAYGSFSYVDLEGTSQAAAEASAAAAVVIASGVPLPRAAPLGVAARLACTATPTGHRGYYGRHGRIDLARAVDPSVGC